MNKEIYLDWGATSYKKPKQVAAAVKYYFDHIGVSSGRGAYKRAFITDKIVYECRKEAAKLFGVTDPARIILTSGATESLNLALKGYLGEGDHVVTTSLEHNAVIRPLYTLKNETGITYTIVKCDEDGNFDLNDFEKSVTSRTKLFAINHASNVTGAILPVAGIAKIAHRHGARVLLDAAQTAGSYKVDINALGVDLLAFTGHKSLLGPAGAGGLYIADGIRLTPLIDGGAGSDSSSLAMPENLPERYEAGTLNYPGICGLKEGIKYINDSGIDSIRKNELEIIRYALERLAGLKRVTLYSCKNADNMVGIFSFNITNIEPAKVAHILDTEYNVMVRAGLHCAPLAHESTGTKNIGSVRASIGYTTTKEEIDIFIESLRRITDKEV